MKFTLNSFHICIGLVLISVLVGCSFITVNYPEESEGMHINEVTVEQIFAEGTLFIHTENNSEFVNLYCERAEGASCYLVDHELMDNWNNYQFNAEVENYDNHIQDKELKSQIMNQIGNHLIVAAPLSGVKLRCRRDGNTQEILGCEIDKGNGWENLPVK